MKTGISRVSATALCIFAVIRGDAASPRFEVPPGFSARVYALGIHGARDLALRADGTLTLRGRVRGERYEIAPPTRDQPVMVMRVAAELDSSHATDQATRAVQAPRFGHMRWNAAQGALAFELSADDGAAFPVPPATLALARALARNRSADIAMAPDGTLFVADSRAGAIWRIRPTRL